MNDMGLGIEEPKHDLGWPSLEATLSGHGASTGVINVSDQRYQNAVDGMENGTEDLKMGDPTVQIRIVFSTISILDEQGKLAKQATPGAESSLSRSRRGPDLR